MREIKFRAWDKSEEIFVDEEYFAVNFVGTVFEACLDEDIYNECDNSNIILMQYTGLKDKNGVEIYESDLVMFMDMEDEPREIVFKNGAFGWKIYIGKAYESLVSLNHLNEDDMNNLEVIGNIYENHELLS